MEKIKKRLGALRLPFKAGIWYTLSSIITKGISLLCTPVFTRLMSEADYALYPLYLGKMGIISALGGADALGAALLVGMQKFSQRKNDLVRSAIVLEGAIIGAICLLYFAFYGIFGELGIGGGAITLVMFLQVFFDGITGMILLSRRYEYKYRTVFFANVLSSMASAALGIFITQRFSLGGEGRIVALLFVSAATAFILLLGYAPGEAAVSAELMRYLLIRTVPLIPHGLGTALLAAVDRLMIPRYYGAGALAKYSVAHSLGVSVCFISSALTLALRPWILRRLHAGEGERVRETADLIIQVLCVPVLGVICIAPEAMHLLAPPGYSEALTAVPPVALSVLPAFLSSVTATALLYRGRSGFAILPVGAGVLTSILLNLLFFTLLPYTSAAFSSLIAGCVSLLIWWAIYRRVAREAVFSPRKFASAFLVCSALGLCIYLLRDLPEMRYIILSLVLIVPLPLYKKAVTLVKE